VSYDNHCQVINKLCIGSYDVFLLWHLMEKILMYHDIATILICEYVYFLGRLLCCVQYSEF
jgi:hypothetical protein